METTGVDQQIQVTEAVYTRLKDRYNFQPRGKVSVKGKGEMDTYFLLGPIDMEAANKRNLAEQRRLMGRSSDAASTKSGPMLDGMASETDLGRSVPMVGSSFARRSYKSDGSGEVGIEVEPELQNGVDGPSLEPSIPLNEKAGSDDVVIDIGDV